MAFLLCGGFSDLGGMREHRYGVPHTLIGRYVNLREYESTYNYFGYIVFIICNGGFCLRITS
ncbi:TPA: hypothetical protein NKB17_003003 [Vibrio parahaemolyticus]|nr:hypothetical protein [Vibrio parahaemolyticus]